MGNPVQILDADKSCFFGVKEGEDSVDILRRVIGEQPGGEQVNELLKGDISRTLSIEFQNDLINWLVASFRAQRRKRCS